MKSHNILYLRGDKHIDDKRYQELLLEEGLEIPDEDLYTPRVNLHYIKQNKERNIPFLKRKLAQNGLKWEGIDEQEL